MNYGREVLTERIKAIIIDLIIIVLMDSAIGVALYFLETGPLVCGLIMWVIPVLYIAVTESYICSATIGMRIFRLQIVDEKNCPISFVRALVRGICASVSCLPLGLGFIYAFFDDEGKTLYDYAVKVFVVPSEERKEQGKPCVVGVGNCLKDEKFYIENGIMMGRDFSSCKVLFKADEPTISRHHCIIRFNPQTQVFLLEDVGSTYGTFLKNGKKLEKGQVAALEVGSCFFLGTKRNMFKLILE